MDFRITKIAITLVICLFTSCTAQRNRNTNKTLNQDQKGLQDYALCQCLSLDDNDTSQDDGSISSYFNMSNYAVEIFTKTDSFVENYLSKNDLQSKFEYNSLHRMECIKLYNSEELRDSVLDMTK